MTQPESFSSQNPLRIGTRASPLAQAQARMAAAALMRHYGMDDDAMRLVPMLSSGDKITDRPLADAGGKALWTKELDRALMAGEIDIAVHSMKDVETLRPAPFHVAAMLPRADICDRLIGAPSIADLPRGAHVGTSSPRRAAMLLALRPDLRISAIRGNVATRLAQIANGTFDATLLAAAGLDRLGEGDVGAAIAPEVMLPAASQGAIGIECLAHRGDLAEFCAAINHRATHDAVMAERAFLAALGGNCHSPVAALALWDDGALWLRGEILREDGSERHRGDARFAADDGAAPAALAARLLEGASAPLRALFGR